MKYDELLKIRDEILLSGKPDQRNSMLNYIDSFFRIEYTHNSTAIEGNTLTLIETKLLLEDKISVGGKDLREIYEVVNHDKALDYILSCIKANEPLSEKIVKDVHAIVMENILVGGVYRNQEVRISGAGHTPPAGMEMYSQIKNYYYDLQERTDLNPIEAAAWTHAEFVRIHPFSDGNGRTSRLLMNYQLLKNNFLPVSIKKENRLNYYNALEEYAINRNIEPFANMIYDLEVKEIEKAISMIEPENEKNSLLQKFYHSLNENNKIDKVIV